MANKSVKLSDFETKLAYIIKDWTELFEDCGIIIKRVWFFGCDVAKAIAQTLTLWELIPNLPEVIKIGKYIGIVISWIKKFKILRWFK